MEMLERVKRFIETTFDLNIKPVEIIGTLATFGILYGFYYICCLLDLLAK